MITVINIFLIALAAYFGLGLLFAIYFVIKGAAKIDPLIGNSKFKVRLLLAPGALITWPCLIGKLKGSKHE